ncbi:MAG TPA: CocE/NonD family hydrolase [Mycobacteriales bacterium]|nr:CocE/NonD family hydrolase [Mycobacteriales bacterium]
MRTPLSRARVVLLAAVVSTGVLLTLPATAAPAPKGSTWSETYIPTPDGQRLHVDVMRPKAAKGKTPVILVVSPYLGMTSQTEARGPSNRFHDFFEGAQVFDRGYSVVMVSLRGTGGSSGCLDILGPGEQTDVVTAVTWAASQPWSTGKVGMYGKSYDANTGMVGAALRPKGLAAVVAQQVVPDRYRGSYNDRVRFLQSLAYPAATYGSSAEGGFSVSNDPEYIANSVSRSADCQALLAEHYLDDPNIAFWRNRDFVTKAKGSTVPTFMTVGYVDSNTNVGGGAVDYFNALAGPKRMWIGWWDHVRGNDLAGDEPAMGREGFFGEVMRFYDLHLKGIKPRVKDPVVVAQSGDGTWTAERSWPASDARALVGGLKAGTYADDATNVGSLDSAAGPGGSGAIGGQRTGAGAWTFSRPLTRAARMAGIPSAVIDVAPLVPRTNVAVNVYDVAPDGKATMVTRGAALADAAGKKSVRLFPTDWVFAPGHRVGVLVSGANAEAYVHVPTRTTVTVNGGSVSLPWLASRKRTPTKGFLNVRLETFRGKAPFSVAASVIADRTDPGFPIPR